MLAFGLGLLAAPKRFGNQRIGQDQLRLGHLLDRQHDVGGFAGRHVIAADACGAAFGAEQLAAEALAALDRHRHFDLHKIIGIAIEVGWAHQRAVDAGRGHFETISALDRIGRASCRERVLYTV